MSRLTVCDVALDPRKGGKDAVWTYRAGETLQVGDAVVVPLGTRSELGFVLRVYEVEESDLDFPLKSLRPVTGKVDGLAMPPELVELCRFVADEYLCELPAALAPALPPGIKGRLTVVWSLADPNPPKNLPPVHDEVLRVIRESGGSLVQAKKMAPAILRALQALRASGVVKRGVRIAPSPERRKAEPLLRLTADAAKVESFLDKQGKRKPAQALTLLQLQDVDRGALTMAEIKALAAVTEATVKALVEAGLLEIIEDEKSLRPSPPPEPNRAQQVAIDAIVEAVLASENRRFLLYGITGSGKTEVFLRAAAEALRMGRQVLYVVPEIALAAQSLGLLRRRFGQTVSILHSNLSDSDRLANWMRVRDGQSPVVLGARSALFAPLGNIGLIVVDEEHEQAYKQESVPRYHAKQVALKLAQLHRCPVVFGSATPSIESFYEAEASELPLPLREREGGEGSQVPAARQLTLLTLPERAAAAQLPAVSVRDLTEDYRRHQPAILTDELKYRIERALADRHQAILFLNRRAYAPFLICRDCGNSMECPNCSVSLSFHRRDKRLRCHHCGYQTSPPQECPKCGSLRLAPFGAGTEKVEEAALAEFPGATVGRLDRDIAKRKGALEQVLASFRSGDIQILVGTQIVAKGLDFPNVTVVGVIAADISLNIPDFRASERTFQLLSQVAGRAGRGTAAGQVVIQTFNPEHPAVQAARSHDYVCFYESLKTERAEAGYPPFRRLVNVLLSGEDQKAVTRATDEVAKRLRAISGLQVLGPVDCAVERSFGKWRRHVLIKLPPYGSARSAGEALSGFEVPGVSIVIDVDPYTMM